MEDKILLKDIHQQNLNFLIGSGASSGLFPTLWLPLKDIEDINKNETIETLATKLENEGKQSHLALLFMYYFQEIIKPVVEFKLEDIDLKHECFLGDSHCDQCKHLTTINNYDKFIESIILLLIEKNNFTRRCNLFTTNYDGCIPFTADKLLESGKYDFAINDGARGFLKRTMSAKNFNSYICQTGVFGKNSSDIPQINLINLHGSVYWKKLDESIQVDYKPFFSSEIIPFEAAESLATLTSILQDETKNTDDVTSLKIELEQAIIDQFWLEYKKLPIVNPTKWKFHETVFEEHYYQMLRLLSYELEQPNSVLITFAFSFADEHIQKLVERSLSNPRLQVYICCFNNAEYQSMRDKFGRFKNVAFIESKEGNLDFSTFNEKVFNADFLRDIEE
tara:strand:+ start:4662 stop:5840 length:1179 start_codon:yes stop_codon:yes gene_type:complete